MALNIFPYALVRYAAMEFSELAAIELPGLKAYLTTSDTLEQDISLSRNALCDQLFESIKAETDDKQRQRLLQLKRAIYNGKEAGAAAQALILPEKDLPLNNALQSHLQLVAQQWALQSEWVINFDEHLTGHRKKLQIWAQDELLRKGILLSSPVLYAQLDNFSAADASAFRNRELKNEYSLLRYITRMAAKTSPFSTFTYTGTGIFDSTEGSNRPVPAATGNTNVSSAIRLNNGLYTYIRSLMIHHPLLNEILEVRLNTSAAVSGEQLSFLVNYFNVESFQSLPARNLPLWLFHFLQTHQTPVTTGMLVDIVSAQMPDTERATIKDFLLKLSAGGLLEPGIGCSGVDPAWDNALICFLEKQLPGNPAITPLLDLLILLNTNKNAYAVAAAHQRQQLLQETAATLNQVLSSLQEAAGLPVAQPGAVPSNETDNTGIPGFFTVNRFAPRYFAPQDIFYEDTCTRAATLLPENAIRIFLDKTETLCKILETLDMLQEEREHMRDFFLQHFGAEKAVTITSFYHAYYLHEKKKAKQQQQQRDVTAINTVDVIGKRLEYMLDNTDIIQDTLQVNLYASHFNTAQYTTKKSGTGRGMFVQFYTERGDEKPVIQGVINALLPGMGKIAGRFLHLFDPAITSTFREWNTALQPAHMMLELNDGSTFNANIHPPLLPFEICMPGGNNNYPADKQVSLKDIHIKYCSKSNELSLFHVPDGRKIFTYDLCLESFYNRSNFYQLLAHFNPEPRLPLRKLYTVTDTKYAAVFSKQEGIQRKPRIIFEEQVVLRRAGWLTDTAIIPVQLKEEEDAAYFVRLNQWRISRGIPEQVFLFLRSHYITSSSGKKNNLQRDDYKPQYISFRQPLLVTLFKKLLSRAGEQLYMEEMLPHAMHLQQEENDTVTEYMLHWYNY